MASKTSSKSSGSRRKSTKSPKKAATRSTKSSLVKADAATPVEAVGDEEVVVDRRRAERRDEVAAMKAPVGPQLERRKKVNRRRQIDPTTCERDYTDQEVEFMNALDDYKRKSGRMFPTCSEVLEVLHGLGYTKLSMSEMSSMPVDDASAASAKPMPSDWHGTDESVDQNNDGAAMECESQLVD